MQTQSNEKNLVTEDTEIVCLPKSKSKRIWEIDFVRGLCIVLMILDHLALLLADYFGPIWYGGPSFFRYGLGDPFTRFCYTWSVCRARDIIHPIVLFIFFSISGISCAFSRSNGKRGLQLAIIALIYTGCSYIAQELIGINNTLVTYGVLHFLATCILIYALISFLTRNGKWLNMAISAAIIVTVLCLYFLYTPPSNLSQFCQVIFPPRDIHGNAYAFYRGYISPGDQFSLIPYSAFFFAGTLFAPLLYGKRRSLLPMLDRGWQKPVSFVGRHALLIYITHMLVLTGLLALISYLFITPGSFGI